VRLSKSYAWVEWLLINIARVGVKVRVGLEQGCTTQISWRAKKVLLKHSRARLVKFFPILSSQI